MRTRSAIVLAGLAAVLAAPMAAAAPEAGVPVITTFAELQQPKVLAIDGAGHLYVGQGDADNQIRAVDAKGVISTVPGTGVLGTVKGLAADKAGDLYILGGDVVYLLSKGTIRPIAGGGTTEIGKARKGLDANLDRARNVAVDPAGGVYVVTNNWLLRVDRDTNDLTVIAGNGMPGTSDPVDGKDATQVPLSSLQAAVTDGAGNVYLGESNRLFLVSKKDGTIRRIPCGEDCGVRQLALSPAGTVHFTKWTNQVLMIDADSKIRPVAGGTEPGDGGDGGKAVDAKLNMPNDLDFDAAGNLYIADTENNRIRKVSPQAAPVATDDSVNTDPGKEITGNVLANDTGTKLTVTAHTEPANGTVTLPADGKFSYQPKDGFTGQDSFSYTVTDSMGQTATAKVTIAVGTAGQPVPQGSNTPSGLASTGASVVWLTVAATGLLGVGGGLTVVAARRRRTARR